MGEEIFGDAEENLNDVGHECQIYINGRLAETVPQESSWADTLRMICRSHGISKGTLKAVQEIDGGERVVGLSELEDFSGISIVRVLAPTKTGA